MQNQQFLKVLMKCGLDMQEAIVYLNMLKIGPNSVLRIASKSEMDRMTTHRVIQRMETKKIIGILRKRKRNLYYAQKPQFLENFLDYEEEQLLDKRENLHEIIPSLTELFIQGQKKPSLHYYEGAEGLKDILKLILAEMSQAKEKIYRVYTPHHGFIDKYINQIYPSFFQKKFQLNIRVKVISYLIPRKLTKISKLEEMEEKYLERRIIPKQFSFSNIHYILDKTIILISFEDDYCKAVSIEEPSFIYSQRQIFDFVWEHAKPV